MNTGSNRSIPPQHLGSNYPKSLRFAEDETTITETSSSSASQHAENQGLNSSSKAVVLLKIIVIFILILSALMLSFLTYYFITSDESDDFESQFADYADKIVKEFLDITHLKVYTCYSLSIAYTTEFEGTDAWPAVSLARFPVKTFGATDLARASCIGFAPYVTDQTRHGWEAYAASVHPTLNLESSALAAISPKSIVPESVELDESTTNMRIEDGIYRIENETAVPDNGPGPYFPLWQVSPITEYSTAIMYNQLSDSSRSKALQTMMKTTRPIYSEVFYQDDFDDSRDEASFETRGVLYFPVFDTFVDGSSVSGAVSAEFNWEDSFRYILPAHAKGIVCVLENTCGQTFTYVIDGEDAVFMGTGDLHDVKYDDMEITTTYEEFLHTYNAAALFNDYSSKEFGFDSVLTTSDIDKETIENTTNSERNMQSSSSSDGCLYLVRIYPSSEFQSRYHTSDAMMYSGFVVLVFVITSVIFISYDCLVQRRQSQVMSTAARANAIVDSLFPAMVRERVFQTNEPGTRGTVGRNSPSPDWNPPSGSAVRGDTPKKRLRSFLQVNRRSSRKIKENVDPMLNPIADLFPETTIMFADIAGFTAWSSEREPGEVFQLLESVYYAFDNVARQMGVFKLETIGDCYVAATGLPEPNKDHAIIMTRFAFECLHQMQETTRKLEITLGPGTSDLDIRVGLHSGPVTGGVLRGEKSRFQLFGDTMNTGKCKQSAKLSCLNTT
jgi:class 3 adenylate cyclase